MTDEPAQTNPAPTGEAAPVEPDQSGESDQPARPEPAVRPSRRPMVAGLSVSAAVAVAAALLVAFAGGPPAIEGAAVSGPLPPPPANLALADPDATRVVLSQIDETIARVFTYDATHRDDAAVAADSVLAGAALGQYDAAMATVRQQGPARGLILTTSVAASAVTGLTARDASALLVVDQKDTHDVTATVASTAVMTITARLMDSRWQITDLVLQPGGPLTPPSLRAVPFPSATPAGVADARDRALAAAEHAGAILTTADWRHLDQSLAAWKAVATGDLSTQLNTGSATFSNQVITIRAVTAGTCVAAGVESVNPLAGHATVIVVVAVTRTSAAAPAPNTATSRW